MNRRGFLRLGGAGLALGAFSPILGNPFLSRHLHAFGPSNPKKMMLIFLRGGNDGLNTVVPHGDSSYNTSPDSRPTLYLQPPPISHDLNGFASLHPSMTLMADLYATGNLAVLHRIAYEQQSRSHFTSQQLWENAMPGISGAATIEDGWINRLVDTDSSLDGHAIPATSISNNMQAAFRGNRALIHMRNISAYRIGADPIDLKMIGAAPSGNDGSGLLGVYSRNPDATDYDQRLRDTGVAMASSLDALEMAGVDENNYPDFDPVTGAFYPHTSGNSDGFNSTRRNFFRQVKNGIQLLKETDCRVVGVELGGFDNHSNQGTTSGGHSENLRAISRAFHSLRLDTLNNIWNDFLVVCVSEFGRTSEENDSFGTDHAEASCMFAAGGAVIGGVKNCDPTTWAQGDMFSTSNGRYVLQRTSFLSVYAEIIERHFGVTNPGTLDTIIPNWSTYAAGPNPIYDYLNFLP